jgi:1,2-phenylacetyl-CoA epoxidase catalytic subunit
MTTVEALSDADRIVLEKIAAGQPIPNLQEVSGKYRELATGILLQYADSEMAGGAGYSTLLPLAPSLAERVALASITYEKLALAQKTYTLVSQTGINIDKYIASHSWEARLGRSAALSYRRMAADKRVNALMYPLQSWNDLVVFTYLMANMACLHLQDFSKSSFEPWAQLAQAHLPIEKTHRDFGITCIARLSEKDSELRQMQLSMQYWYHKVLACFGLPNSERNSLYLNFGLKLSKNEELSSTWESEVRLALRNYGIDTPEG